MISQHKDNNFYPRVIEALLACDGDFYLNNTVTIFVEKFLKIRIKTTKRTKAFT